MGPVGGLSRDRSCPDRRRQGRGPFHRCRHRRRHLGLSTVPTESQVPRNGLLIFPSPKVLFLSILVGSIAFSPARAGEPWGSPDPDTSVGHLPAKWVSDLSNLFIPDN